MKSAWKSAIMRLLIDSLGRMEQEDVDAWLDGNFKFAELLERAFRNIAPYRSSVLRELYQISPSEVFDAWCLEHPEMQFPDKDAVIVRIGGELTDIRALVLTFGAGGGTKKE